jgi:flagellar biosynthetic protein FlhB
MPDQFGEKTQDATPYRRQKAREEGQVAKSQDLASAGLLIGALLIMMVFGGAVVTFLGQLTQRQLGGEIVLAADTQWFLHEWYGILGGLARVMLPVLGLIFIVAVAVNLGQFGFLFLPQKLAFDASRIDPMKGFGRLFAVANFVRLAFGVVKILVVASVAIWSLWGQRETILGLSGLPVHAVATSITSLIVWTCLKIAVALGVLAVLDYFYQRYRHERDLRMTPQEVREELKMLQGDPQMAARRRAVQRQLVLHRLARAVPQADVVVTNPTELAVAIRYDAQAMAAPIVVAKGADLVAHRIRRLALEHDISIVERKPLAQVLYREVDVNAPVPAGHYAAVAEILKYVYELKGVGAPVVDPAT